MSVASVAALAPNPFGGFAPFPNSIMVPFMATQSAVLGYNFGIGYEMGKRTIKSLDNDFFNKIRAGSTDVISVVSDGQEIKMQYNEYISFITKRHGHEQIQIFESMIPNFMKLQDTIIEKSVDIELKKANRTPSAMVEIVQAFAGASAKELTEKVDLLAETEKTFVLTTQPIIALIYFFFKLTGGKTEPSFTPDPTEPKEPEPLLKEPEPEPVAPFEPEPKEPEPVPLDSIYVDFTYTIPTGKTIHVTQNMELSQVKSLIKNMEDGLNSGGLSSQYVTIYINYIYYLRKTWHDKYNVWI